MKNIMFILLAFPILFMGCIGPFNPPQNVTNGTINESNIANLSVGVGDLPVLGKSSAPVTWIEFSDYQCPYCAKLVTEGGSQVESNYVNTGKVKMYFRDWPLYFHEKANEAAMAARCADDQDKFWDMHDKLYQNQQTWTTSSDFTGVLEGYAGDLGMDKAAFKSCLASSKYSSQISEDTAAGKSAGVTGTPAVFMLLPKDKTDFSKLKTALSSGYGPYMKLYQDKDNYIVMVAGAFPYDAFKSVLDTVG